MSPFLSAQMAESLTHLIQTIDSNTTQNPDWIDAVCTAREAVTKGTIEALAAGAAPFAASNAIMLVSTLEIRIKELADALEWIENQAEAAPLESELRIMGAALSAIKAEYAPGYFD